MELLRPKSIDDREQTLFVDLPALGVIIGARLGLNFALTGVFKPASFSNLTTSMAIAGLGL